MPNDLAYPAATVVLSALFLQYLAVKVSSFRRLAKQDYPTMYSTKEECEKDRTHLLFNCAQRAHQNTLENYPIWLVLMGVSSHSYPKTAAGLGLIWIAGRYAYAQGYYSGDPKKRIRGGFQYIGLLGLLGTSVATIYSMLQ